MGASGLHSSRPLDELITSRTDSFTAWAMIDRFPSARGPTSERPLNRQRILPSTIARAMNCGVDSAPSSTLRTMLGGEVDRPAVGGGGNAAITPLVWICRFKLTPRT